MDPQSEETFKPVSESYIYEVKSSSSLLGTQDQELGSKTCLDVPKYKYGID